MATGSTTRAARPPAKGGKGGKGSELMGIPTWMWVTGGLVVGGGYLYLRSRQSAQQQTPGGGGQGGRVFAIGSPTGLSFEQLLLILKDWQHGHHGHGGGGGGGHHHKHHGGKGGPERQWLIQKTGSQHPWTYLAQHHERIVIGPHGTRIIRGPGGGGKKRRGTG